MTFLKSITLGAVVGLIAGQAMAETVLNTDTTRLYEADYAAHLDSNGYAVGVAVYGQHDADYDAFLTDAALFKPLLGHHDADYEVHLNHAAFVETTVALR